MVLSTFCYTRNCLRYRTLNAVKPTNSSTEAVKPADTLIPPALCMILRQNLKIKLKKLSYVLTYLISVSCFGEITVIPLQSNSGMRLILICHQNFLHFSKHCLEVGNYQPEVESSSDNQEIYTLHTFFFIVPKSFFKKIPIPNTFE